MVKVTHIKRFFKNLFESNPLAINVKRIQVIHLNEKVEHIDHLLVDTAYSPEEAINELDIINNQLETIKHSLI